MAGSVRNSYNKKLVEQMCIYIYYAIVSEFMMILLEAGNVILGVL